MLTDKPTPEQVEAFLKSLPDDELLEISHCRARQNDGSPFVFISKTLGTNCTFNDDNYHQFVEERAVRAREKMKNRLLHPTPEELDTFLKSLSDDELLELVVTRAHHDNRTPIEFVSKSTGLRCGIDNDAYQLAVKERADRAKKLFDGLGVHPKTVKLLSDDVNPLTLLRDDEIIPFGGRDGVTNRPWRVTIRPPVLVGLDVGPLGEGQFSTVPSQYFYAEQLNRGTTFRQLSSTERFEKFVDKLPIEELFELGDLLIKHPNSRSTGIYRSLTLGQEERVYREDLPLVFETIKSRYNGDPVL